MDEHLADVRRYDALAEAATIERIVRHLDAAPGRGDAVAVACGEESDLRSVRDNWCRKTLGAEDAHAIDRAVGLVCRTMERDSLKNRATFYYLCAKHLRKVEAI